MDHSKYSIKPCLLDLTYKGKSLFSYVKEVRKPLFS